MPAKRAFKEGEGCPVCRARKYYVEDGKKWCENNHEIQGHLEYDDDEELEAGRMGKVSRREKEKAEGETKQKHAGEGMTLFLESLQLCLRMQVEWLMNSQDHPPELEIVTRDLWDLRVRGCAARLATADTIKSHRLQEFSTSEAESSAVETTSQKKVSRRWGSARKGEWPMPNVLETLALCHLGCVLVRVPTSLGCICRWAHEGILPFRNLYHELPADVRDRLPSTHVHSIKTLTASNICEGDIHTTVGVLVRSFYKGYGLEFPGLNYVPMLVQYSRELSLPVEVITLASGIITFTNRTFRYRQGSESVTGNPGQQRKEKTRVADNPELSLVAMLIVAAKCVIPFDDNIPVSQNLGDVSRLLMNWNVWGSSLELSAPEEHPPEAPSPSDVTQEAIVSMSDYNFDRYLAQLKPDLDEPDAVLETLLRNRDSVRLPGHDADASTSLQCQQPASTLKLHACLRHVCEEGRSTTAGDGGYASHKNTDDLPQGVEILYAQAALACAVPIKQLVRAVYLLESSLHEWSKKASRK